MKTVKRFLSTICAFSVIATAAVSLTAYAANEEVDTNKPTFTITCDNYNEETGSGELSYYIEGLKVPTETSKVKYTGMSMFKVSLKADSKDFDVTDWSDDFGVFDVVLPESAFSSDMQIGPYDASAQTLTQAWTAASYQKCVQNGPLSGEKLGNKIKLETVKFKKVDPKDSVTVEIPEALFQVTEYKTPTTKASDKTYRASLDMINIVLPEIPGVEFKVPTNTGATADSSAILNVKPSDVGGTGDVWASADGSENAVAGLANFTPSAATSTIEWTISATPVGGEATQYTKAFDLGASIDAAATIGLIVNYNTAEYSSVSIVSGALK